MRAIIGPGVTKKAPTRSQLSSGSCWKDNIHEEEKCFGEKHPFPGPGQHVSDPNCTQEPRARGCFRPKLSPGTKGQGMFQTQTAPRNQGPGDVLDPNCTQEPRARGCFRPKLSPGTKGQGIFQTQTIPRNQGPRNCLHSSCTQEPRDRGCFRPKLHPRTKGQGMFWTQTIPRNQGPGESLHPNYPHELGPRLLNNTTAL